jgi:epoxyqueuosine reductase
MFASPPPASTRPADPARLLEQIRQWSIELGFQQLAVSSTELGADEARLRNWLAKGYHGDMDYMARHGDKRSRPAELVPGTLRVISVRMDYFPPDATQAETVLDNPQLGYISRYALGRDYHKLMRRRLQQLADKISDGIGDFGYRVFVDSAPVLEKALAQQAGLGWIGKHTNLINQKAGSWFFLGELYTDLPLPVSSHPGENHCGSCRACLDVCPTQAIVAPYQLDARRCISYLTIEYHGVIAEEFHTAIGNRIYGCDDCQLCCPWNRFAAPTQEPDFFSRHPLDAPDLLELFAWDEAEFLRRTEGSAMRRIGYAQWRRNLVVALGNAPYAVAIISALQLALQDAAPVLAEQVRMALARLETAAGC